MLKKLSQSKSLEDFFNAWQTKNPAYLILKKTLSLYQDISHKGGWPSVTTGDVLKPRMKDARILEVRARLAVTDGAGAPSSDLKAQLYDDALVQAVKNFQRRHGLEADGVIGPKTIESMNVSVEERLRQITLSMERWRWMPEDYGDHFLAVNIARFKLLSIQNLRIEDEMRVVVGAPYHRTTRIQQYDEIPSH